MTGKVTFFFSLVISQEKSVQRVFLFLSLSRDVFENVKKIERRKKSHKLSCSIYVVHL